MVSLAMSLAGELQGGAVHVSWRARGALTALPSAGLGVIGILCAPGFAAERRLAGRLVCTGRALEHRWQFVADDGRPYCLEGTQRLSTRGMPPAFSCLTMNLLRDGAAVGTARLRFDARNDFGPLLRSIRLW